MVDSACILVVEDEFLIADLLSEMVLDMGFRVCGVADTADEAVIMALESKPTAILMDVRLKGERDGVDAALAIRSKLACPVVFVTGSREPATVARIQADHPAAILFKPIRFEQLQQAVHAAVS